MDAAVLVAIILTVLVLIGLMVWGARRRSAVQLEQARYRASEARDAAWVAETEALERDARAERERRMAEQARRDAAALHQHADEIDPDVEIDIDAETDLDEEDETPPAPTDDPYTVDLREARAARDASSSDAPDPRAGASPDAFDRLGNRLPGPPADRAHSRTCRASSRFSTSTARSSTPTAR